MTESISEKRIRHLMAKEGWALNQIGQFSRAFEFASWFGVTIFMGLLKADGLINFQTNLVTQIRGETVYVSLVKPLGGFTDSNVRLAKEINESASCATDFVGAVYDNPQQPS